MLFQVAAGSESMVWSIFFEGVGALEQFEPVFCHHVLCGLGLGAAQSSFPRFAIFVQQSRGCILRWRGIRWRWLLIYGQGTP
jgi:hypothetical protein